jgi:predicted Rossmann fold flavoprotein
MMSKSKFVETVIIGGGASGLIAGAMMKNKDFLILEGNHKVGHKILISGGAKCNITNKRVSQNNYLGDKIFIKQVLNQFNNHKVVEWFSSQNLELILKNEYQYFCKDGSFRVVDILTSHINSKSILTNTKVKSVSKKDDFFLIETSNGSFQSKNLIVASGGLSYSSIGATDIGYKIASSFGHTIIPSSPALVGFTLQKEQFIFKNLSGVSSEVIIKVEDKKFQGSMLFAHKGLSGPAILNASLYWKKGMISIDFLPNLNLNSIKSSKKLVNNSLNLPSRLCKVLLELLKIEDIPCNKLTKNDWLALEGLHDYRFSPAGNFGYTKAEVTRGGVSTHEIDSSTMMSKKIDNLYFLGEVLDVTGELGGYNFQWAFSSAVVCARGI